MSHFAAVLGVSRTSRYRKPTIQSGRDEADIAELRAIHDLHPSYGYRRLATALGWSWDKTRRLMKLAGLQGSKAKRKIWRSTAKPEKAAPTNQLAKLEAPTQSGAWVQDFTYMWFCGRWLHAERSIGIHVVAANSSLLGRILFQQGEYAKAKEVFLLGFSKQKYYTLYENLAELSITYGNPATDLPFLESSAEKFPQNATIWTALAVARYRTGDTEGAKSAISVAHLHAKNDFIDDIYKRLMSNQPPAFVR